MTETLKHWRTERDDHGILWYWLDKADSSVNTLSSEVLGELDQLLIEIESDPPKGLVICSAKASGFIAGADVNEFLPLGTEQEALELIQRGQDVLDRLSSIDCPTVAMINGFCLGGGMELALACKYRIVDDDPKVRLGLPEVMLGIHPGFGGTVRLPRLTGALAAMDLMLSGRTINGRAARRIGMVDYAVPTRHLQEGARQMIINPPQRRKLSLVARLSNHRLLRPWLARVFRRKVAAKAARKHYPAPYAVIDLWQKYYDRPGRMMAAERESVAGLVRNSTARNLIRVFFLQEQLKSVGDKSLITPRHIHVIGGGVMGGDIAIWCALRGFDVTLQDRRHETIARVYQRAWKLFKKKLKQPRLVQMAMERLVPDIDGLGIARADVIIEAIFEDVEAKQKLFRDVEQKARPDALLATNTSSIPLEAIGSVLDNPARLVGLHFFNPVAVMQLVEIVAGEGTDPEVTARATAFTRHINKLPVPVTSSPGFLVNRILMPYLIEAVTIEQEGITAETIDKSALDFGMPMGPIELADTVGLDICLHVAENLSQAYGVEVPSRLKELVQAGKLGKKSGQGFYAWAAGKVCHKDSKARVNQEVIDRMIFRFLNEAVACHREAVTDNDDLLDAGIIFGTGFAPFRGGPINYLREQGVQGQRERLLQLQEKFGERFRPDAGWDKLTDKE